MKTLVLSLFLAFSSTLSIAQVPSIFLGEWEGSGTLMGKEATFEMTWEQVLNDEFLKLNFKNGFSDGSFSMEATAFYKLNPDGTFSGFWFDSRGVSFPLNGSFTSNSITTEWENPGVEKGRTEYRVLESGEIQVFDFVFKEGSFSKFGEVTYQRQIDAKLQGFTLAAKDIESMVNFYSLAFDVQFTALIIDEYLLYKGEWLGLSILICPAEFAKNYASQTRHQLEFTTTNFDKIIQKIKHSGGTLLGKIATENGKRRVGFFDPDKNSMVLIESTKN